MGQLQSPKRGSAEMVHRNGGPRRGDDVGCPLGDRGAKLPRSDSNTRQWSGDQQPVFICV